jgi:carbonic anhydrase
MRESATARVEPKKLPARGESADESLAHLVDGFRRFRTEVYPEQQALFARLAKAQRPRAMFITCADSRIVPELITQSSPGDLFVTRNVGNVVPPYGQMNGGVSSAIEYAVLALNVQHIIVDSTGRRNSVVKTLDGSRVPQSLSGSFV